MITKLLIVGNDTCLNLIAMKKIKTDISFPFTTTGTEKLVDHKII